MLSIFDFPEQEGEEPSSKFAPLPGLTVETHLPTDLQTPPEGTKLRWIHIPGNRIRDLQVLSHFSDEEQRLTEIEFYKSVGL